MRYIYDDKLEKKTDVVRQILLANEVDRVDMKFVLRDSTLNLLAEKHGDIFTTTVYTCGAPESDINDRLFKFIERVISHE